MLAAILTDPKFLAMLVTLACQLGGQIGLHLDPVATTTVLSPVYLYILAHAHVQAAAASVTGSTQPTAVAAPAAPVAISPSLLSSAAASLTPVKLLVLVLLAIGASASLAACSSAQRSAETAAAKCTASDVDKIVACLERADLNGAGRLLCAIDAVGPDVLACVAKTAPAAGSGSAK